MYRLFDWDCPKCESLFDALVWHDAENLLPPKQAEQTCPMCNTTMVMKRRQGGGASCPAPYMGEKILNPSICGGNYDTMGGERAPTLPKFAPVEEYSKKASDFVAQGGDVRYKNKDGEMVSSDIRNAPVGIIQREINANVPGKPMAEDLGDHLEKAEYKEVRGARKRAIARNVAKKKRADALARGEKINMRRDRCEGDPKF